MSGPNRDTVGEEALAETDIHHVLSNDRRRMVLDLLGDSNGESMTARELSERIAELETGESPPPRNIRQSAYVALHQTHLPKLEDYGIVEYDDSTKEVALTDRMMEVDVFMETVPKYGISWSEYYLLVAVLGGLLVTCSELGVPVVSSVEGFLIATTFFVLIGASGVYQTYSEGRSILHRHLR